ncbi:hypothetical protein [Bergeyella porcorum]|uniref:hypothetical protein n=1 Tax=Bergeyella porcorum TaxID=1735111 RepID=UPI00399CF6D3
MSEEVSQVSEEVSRASEEVSQVSEKVSQVSEKVSRVSEKVSRVLGKVVLQYHWIEIKNCPIKRTVFECYNFSLVTSRCCFAF